MAESANVFLKNRGIIVRRMLAYGLPDCLRVSIGRENEMKTTIGALKEFIEKS